MLDRGMTTWHGMLQHCWETPPGAKDIYKKSILWVVSFPESAITTKSTLLTEQLMVKHWLVWKMSVTSLMWQNFLLLWQQSHIHPTPLPLYLECQHKEKGSCKAEARCPNYLPPHPNHAALPGLPEQLHLGIRKVSSSKVFTLCCWAFPLYPYCSSWWLLLLKKSRASTQTAPSKLSG